MIARDRAAAFTGRFCITHNCAALVRIVRGDNVSGTLEDTWNFVFNCADVCAVTSRFVGDAGIIDCSWFAALIECRTCGYPRVDRIAAGLGFHRLSWTTIVRENCEHWVCSGQIACAGEARCFSRNAEQVMPVAGYGA